MAQEMIVFCLILGLATSFPVLQERANNETVAEVSSTSAAESTGTPPAESQSSSTRGSTWHPWDATTTEPPYIAHNSTVDNASENSTQLNNTSARRATFNFYGMHCTLFISKSL